MNKSETPIVSVWCTVYNHEPYLRQCLDGFVMQKTAFPFEVIVHDDASTDGSAEIIKKYAEKYPNIIKPIYEKENQYSKHDDTLFRLLKTSCVGKYTALCEGDDYWIDPEKLQKQVEIMENDPTFSFCFSNYKSTSGKIKKKMPQTSRLRAKDVIHRHYVPTASLLYRTELLSNVDNFNLSIGDRPLEIQLAMQGDAYFIDEPLCVYRDNNPTSIKHNSEHRRRSVLVWVKMYYSLWKKYMFKKNSIYLLRELLYRLAQLPIVYKNTFITKNIGTQE